MTRIAWDGLDDRFYEIGVDHGVLYVPDDAGDFLGVPWNGLTRVTKTSTRETEATYYDGVKIHNYVKQKEFQGSMSAIMYPDEFERLDGSYELMCGVSLGEQPPGLFGLCYRSQIGNASGNREGYRLHILYNLIATPDDRNYETMGDSPKLMEFSWNLESIPELVSNFRPTAEITIDSRKTDPWLLQELEDILYGTDDTEARLPEFSEMIEHISGFARLKIELDSDPESPTYGVFTVTERKPGTYIVTNLDGSWAIVGTDTEIYDDHFYDLTGIGCVLSERGSLFVITIEDLGDGRWRASTDFPDLITVTDEGLFTIDNANVIFDSGDQYRIADTLKD